MFRSVTLRRSLLAVLLVWLLGCSSGVGSDAANSTPDEVERPSSSEVAASPVPSLVPATATPATRPVQPLTTVPPATAIPDPMPTPEVIFELVEVPGELGGRPFVSYRHAAAPHGDFGWTVVGLTYLDDPLRRLVTVWSTGSDPLGTWQAETLPHDGFSWVTDVAVTDLGQFATGSTGEGPDLRPALWHRSTPSEPWKLSRLDPAVQDRHGEVQRVWSVGSSVLVRVIERMAQVGDVEEEWRRTIWRSDDGESWSRVALEAYEPLGDWVTEIVGSDSLLVAVGGSAADYRTPQAWVSDNGGKSFSLVADLPLRGNDAEGALHWSAITFHRDRFVWLLHEHLGEPAPDDDEAWHVDRRFTLTSADGIDWTVSDSAFAEPEHGGELVLPIEHISAAWLMPFQGGLAAVGTDASPRTLWRSTDGGNTFNWNPVDNLHELYDEQDEITLTGWASDGETVLLTRAGYGIAVLAGDDAEIVFPDSLPTGRLIDPPHISKLRMFDGAFEITVTQTDEMPYVLRANGDLVWERLELDQNFDVVNAFGDDRILVSVLRDGPGGELRLRARRAGETEVAVADQPHFVGADAPGTWTYQLKAVAFDRRFAIFGAHRRPDADEYRVFVSFDTIAEDGTWSQQSLTNPARPSARRTVLCPAATGWLRFASFISERVGTDWNTTTTLWNWSEQVEVVSTEWASKAMMIACHRNDQRHAVAFGRECSEGDVVELETTEGESEAPLLCRLRFGVSDDLKVWSEHPMQSRIDQIGLNWSWSSLMLGDGVLLLAETGESKEQEGLWYLDEQRIVDLTDQLPTGVRFLQSASSLAATDDDVMLVSSDQVFIVSVEALLGAVNAE